MLVPVLIAGNYSCAIMMAVLIIVVPLDLLIVAVIIFVLMTVHVLLLFVGFAIFFIRSRVALPRCSFRKAPDIYSYSK